MNSLGHIDETPMTTGRESREEEGRPAGSPDGDINSQGERIQKLLERIEVLPYPAAKQLIQECMEAVLAFYGQGLNRILQVVNEAGPEGRKVYRDLIHDADWTVIENAQQLLDGAWMPVRVGEVRLVVCKVNGIFYAYRNRCPACNTPFDAGNFDCGSLSCTLGHRYDVVHAGRCAEIPSVHLDPFPLLVQEGLVKVALAREVAVGVP